MPAKVFISCGQANEAERVVAREIASWFQSLGFTPYVATEVQSIPDLNKGIIGALKSSDYYLFINFRREKLSKGTRKQVFRGSLYTNQELAIAYALGFDQMLFLNQHGTERGGMFGTIVSNSPEFEKLDQLLAAVKQAVGSASWSPKFSRHLILEKVVWSVAGHFHDRVQWAGFSTKGMTVRVLHGYIANRRPDVGATSVVARLQTITTAGQPTEPSPDQTPLKVTHEPAFEQTIWPNASGRFDLLAVDAVNPVCAFLISRHDSSPRQPIFRSTGTYHLRYQVFALEFPLLEFDVKLELTGDLATTTAKLF